MESNTIRATVERAREYLASVRRHKVADRPRSVLARECAELRRLTGQLLAIIDGLWISAPAPGSEQDQRRAGLLAEVPESERSAEEHRHHDEASAVATLIASLGDDTAATVTSWLRAARREAPGRPSYTVRAKRWEHGLELHIDGVGVTQSYGLDDAEMMARDLIAINEDVPAGSFDVMITPEPEGLTAPQREKLGQALGDAVAYWQREATAKCDDCENSATDLCEDHATALDRIDAYRTLARQLHIQVRES